MKKKSKWKIILYIWTKKLKCDTIIMNYGGEDMVVWDGNKNDTTNFVTDKYLKINSCGFQCAASDYTVIRRKGRHDYHILLVTGGTCEVFHNCKSYTLTEGSLILYEPYEEQEYSFKSGSTSLWCHFCGNIVGELLDSCNIKSGVYFLKPDKAIFESYSNLIQRFHQPGKKNLANPSFMELIYNISYAITFSEQKDNSDTILPILAYINTNYNKQITIDELAKKSGFSKSRFSHIFSHVTDTTPIKYLNDIRLKMSCEMLSATNESIAEIAIACGFNDPLYFSRLFKRKYGTTPSEYRLSFGKL